VTRKSNAFSFSSEEGKDLIHQILRDPWPHTPKDYQIEAVAKGLDGIDVLAILPTGAGKTAILIMFMLILIHVKLNPEGFASHCSQFPDDPIAIVVYPTNCLEEEQVCMYTSRACASDEPRIAFLGYYIQRGETYNSGHQCRNTRSLRYVDQGGREGTAGTPLITRAVDIQEVGAVD